MDTENDTDDVVNSSRPIPMARFESREFREGYSQGRVVSEKEAAEDRMVSSILGAIVGGCIAGSVIYLLSYFMKCHGVF